MVSPPFHQQQLIMMESQKMVEPLDQKAVQWTMKATLDHIKRNK